MNTDSIKPRSRCGAPIGIQAKEVGTHSLDAINHQYGRRIEIDRSWTVYHIRTGQRRVWACRVISCEIERATS
jgi:hypothetical protein